MYFCKTKHRSLYLQWAHIPFLRLTLPFAQFVVIPLRSYRRLSFYSLRWLVWFYKNTNDMAKKAKKSETAKGPVLEIVNPNAAGIDIANSEMQVCVPMNRAPGNSNRKFGVYTEDLKAIAEWLVECRIDTVAIEATGVYWLGIYKTLLEYGIDVVLGNAANVKNVVDRKTDENDAAWLMTLHAYGLVKPSHQLENFCRSMRNLYRHRQTLIEDASQAVNRMHKAMTQMNIKLSVAISDIVGKSGTAIIEAIIAGERNPSKLAALADRRCKKSKEEIAKSLDGEWDEGLVFILSQEYEIYKGICARVQACDRKIDEFLCKYDQVANVKTGKEPEGFIPSKKKATGHNKVGFDIERYCHALLGVNIMRIPGFSTTTALGLLMELGPSFIDKFETPDRFCRWCNVAPSTRVSGGKVLSCRTEKRYNRVGQLLRMAAATLYNSKDPLGNYYRRMKCKGGSKYANVATAHKLGVIMYNMIKNHKEYDVNKVGTDEITILQRKIAREQKRLEKLKIALAKAS